MNEEFVTFEIAKKLKEKGFREECLCHYIDNDIVYNLESPIANNQMWFCHNKYNNIWHRDNIDAPTISQVLKWLREDRDMYISVDLYQYDKFAYLVYTITPHELIDSVSGYDTYEEAALAGIEYVLDNLI